MILDVYNLSVCVCGGVDMVCMYHMSMKWNNQETFAFVNLSPVKVRQTGSCDSLLRCGNVLYLDTPLFKLQNTKKQYRTKNNCVFVHLGQILHKNIQKD